MTDDEPATLFLTNYLVRHFDAFVIKGLGLDFPQRLDTYFGNYYQVLYLAQMENPALEAKAEQAAARLGLRLVIRRTGLGGMIRFLSASLA